MKRLFVGAVALSMVACGGSGDGSGGTAPAAKGPAAMGIISGNNQIVTAGRDSLPLPVVGQLVRLSNGTVAFRVLKVGNTLLDLLVPRAMAQGGTTLTGSPIPGAVTCAVNLDSVITLTPYQPCVNTDLDGMVTYYYTPGKISGKATSQIRCTVDNLPSVCATATAEIVPGDPAMMIQDSSSDGFTLGAPSATRMYSAKPGMKIPLRGFVRCTDKYGNRTSCGTLGWNVYQWGSAPPEAQIAATATGDTAVTLPIVALDRHETGGSAAYNAMVDSTRFAVLNQQAVWILTGALKTEVLFQVTP